jgi:hypothetical protein
MAYAVGREIVVAHVHLAHDPLQRVGRLLGLVDDRRDQVRDALVRGELDPLRVDQQQPHLVGVARRRIETSRVLRQLDLPVPGRAGDEMCGIFGRLAVT